jgi:hypothetical protein
VFTISDEIPAFFEENESQSHQMLRTLLARPSTDFVDNVRTKISVLNFENDAWALTINQKEYDNALICSPYTTYVTYPLHALNKFKKMWIKGLILLNSSIMAGLCRLTKFNQVVQVNNNLNSLIRHPAVFSDRLPGLTVKLIRRYPTHAINVFRVNEALDSALLSALKNAGYLVFPDRIAHVFFPEKEYIRRSHTKRDLSLLKKTNYTILLHDELTPEDADRFAQLYRQLFIDKHSKHNPVYTAAYFREAVQNHWHDYTAFRNSDGRIDGFISWFIKDNTMICGPLGYDSDVDRKTGVYRQLVALCLKQANENQIVFNMGGGSDEFKLNRGSVETMEYTAVYCRHLSFYRQIPWKMMHWACNKFLKKVVDESSL